MEFSLLMRLSAEGEGKLVSLLLLLLAALLLLLAEAAELNPLELEVLLPRPFSLSPYLLLVGSCDVDVAPAFFSPNL